MFRCERSDRIYSPQLPFAGPLAYKADNHKKIWKKEDSRNRPPETGRQIVPAFVCL